jgi:hypothetical protein
VLSEGPRRHVTFGPANIVAVWASSAMCRGLGAAEFESFCRACLSYLDSSLSDTLFRIVICPEIRALRGYVSEGVYWHEPADFRAAASPSGIVGEARWDAFA